MAYTRFVIILVDAGVYAPETCSDGSVDEVASILLLPGCAIDHHWHRAAADLAQVIDGGFGIHSGLDWDEKGAEPMRVARKYDVASDG